MFFMSVLQLYWNRKDRYNISITLLRLESPVIRCFVRMFTCSPVDLIHGTQWILSGFVIVFKWKWRRWVQWFIVAVYNSKKNSKLALCMRQRNIYTADLPIRNVMYFTQILEFLWKNSGLPHINLSPFPVIAIVSEKIYEYDRDKCPSRIRNILYCTILIYAFSV